MNKHHGYCPVKIIADKAVSCPNLSYEEVLNSVKKHLLITFPDKDLNRFINKDKLYENAAGEGFINKIVNTKDNKEIDFLGLDTIYKYDLATIFIHGNNDGLSYYNTEDKKTISLGSLKKDIKSLDQLSHSLQNILQEQGKIFLFACSTFKKGNNNNTISSHIHKKTGKSTLGFSRDYGMGTFGIKRDLIILGIGSVNNMFVIDEENNLSVNKTVFKEYFSFLSLFLSLLFWIPAASIYLPTLKSLVEDGNPNYLRILIKYILVSFLSLPSLFYLIDTCRVSIDIDDTNVKEDINKEDFNMIIRRKIGKKTGDALLEDNSSIEDNNQK